MGNRGQFEDRRREQERENAKTPDIARCVWCNKAVGEAHVSCIHGEGMVTHGQASKPPVSSFTSTLGPVKLDPNSEAERARVVREALRAAAMEETGAAHEHLWQAAALASDGTLTKLKRLLKH